MNIVWPVSKTYSGKEAALSITFFADAQFKDCLSPSEVEFLRAYSASVQVYQSDVGLPLFSPIEEPPKSLYANVRVVRECGKISTENGTVDFKKGIRYTLLRTDIEYLILQKYLEEVP